MDAPVNWWALATGNSFQALHRLRQAVDEFVGLADESGMQPRTVCLHRTVGAMHRVCALVAEAEEAGVSRTELDAAVAPARELQGASPFVRRLQTWPGGYPGDFETISCLMEQTNRAPVGEFHFVEQ